MKKGDIAPITIEKIVQNGMGLGDANGFKIFVPSTVPGDKINCLLKLKKRRHGIGKIASWITPSKLRKKSMCSHFPTCGGCQWIDVDYNDQLDLKVTMLKDVFSQDHPELIPQFEAIRGHERDQQPKYHRNKMEFAFGHNASGDIILGLKERGTYDKVIELSHCYLLSKESNDIITFTLNYFRKKDLTCWDYSTHQGVLRHMMVRHTKAHNQYLINLIVSEDHPEIYQDFASKLASKFSSIEGIFASIQPTQSDSTFTNTNNLLIGNSFVQEKIGPLTFNISVQSFFQTNSHQVQTLYDTILECADLSSSDTVLDLYCGTGTIGLYLANKVKQIIGIEENGSAIKNAKENASQNNIHNAHFYEGRVKNILKFNDFSPDCVIVDPPRAGMVPKALRRMIELKSPQIIYVSCNPSTFSRDLIDLKEAGYHVDRFIPVDMFPHTSHVECVTKLSLIKE